MGVEAPTLGDRKIMELAAKPPGVVVRVPGKINLALRSGPRRSDGYHSLATVFQAVSIYDEVTADWAGRDEIRIEVTGPQANLVPTGPDNLAYRAAELLARWAGRKGRRGVKLRINKSIPVTGGMAGGSADAAAALLACAEIGRAHV
jgi:4-diphosphocytidyl-2-C-methyl-D-erythritol kinase